MALDHCLSFFSIIDLPGAATSEAKRFLPFTTTAYVNLFSSEPIFGSSEASSNCKNEAGRLCYRPLVDARERFYIKHVNWIKRIETHLLAYNFILAVVIKPRSSTNERKFISGNIGCCRWKQGWRNWKPSSGTHQGLESRSVIDHVLWTVGKMSVYDPWKGFQSGHRDRTFISRCRNRLSWTALDLLRYFLRWRSQLIFW